ncbi:MAG: acetyl-CoA carboxylase biotin carboxyl carrier protein [Candidatus Omnitrophica bacterium]|nr:acetyl-CoA carboxylase biotin carboxyl carrier protein [Candidatus Omnitrophota bacterium]
MDIKKLKEFIEFMKENELAELEIEENGKKIKLTRAGLQKIMPAPQPQPNENSQPAQFQAEPTQAKDNLLEIKAPMVGTFYRAPAPNATPFIEIDSGIGPGDVVCIIEAMKLMNEIKSEIKGKVVDILADNGEPVEYGQTLFLIKPL